MTRSLPRFWSTKFSNFLSGQERGSDLEPGLLAFASKESLFVETETAAENIIDILEIAADDILATPCGGIFSECPKYNRGDSCWPFVRQQIWEDVGEPDNSD